MSLALMIGKVPLLVLLGLSAVFNDFDHERLAYHHTDVGIGGCALWWFHSMHLHVVLKLYPMPVCSALRSS